MCHCAHLISAGIELALVLVWVHHSLAKSGMLGTHFSFRMNLRDYRHLSYLAAALEEGTEIRVIVASTVDFDLVATDCKERGIALFGRIVTRT
jgi:hypothetical protein